MSFSYDPRINEWWCVHFLGRNRHATYKYVKYIDGRHGEREWCSSKYVCEIKIQHRFDNIYRILFSTRQIDVKVFDDFARNKSDCFVDFLKIFRHYFTKSKSKTNMNEETRFTWQNYVLLVKTVHGDPSDKVTITIKGSEGQTEKLYLGKSQVILIRSHIVPVCIRYGGFFYRSSPMRKRLRKIKLTFSFFPVKFLSDKSVKYNSMRQSIIKQKSGSINKLL